MKYDKNYFYILRREAVVVVEDEYFPVCLVEGKYSVAVGFEFMFGLEYLKCESCEYTSKEEAEGRVYDIKLDIGVIHEYN